MSIIATVMGWYVAILGIIYELNTGPFPIIIYKVKMHVYVHVCKCVYVHLYVRSYNINFIIDTHTT